MLRSPYRHTFGPGAAARAAAVALTLVILAAPCRPIAAQAGVAAEEGVLRNADLEEGFVSVPSGHGTVAVGWSPWWIEGKAQQLAQGQYHAPTFEPQANASGQGVHSRSYAQRLSTQYATHEGGIYQRVAVTPGSVVRFSMWARVWSTSADDRDRSYKAGDYRVSVGLDPYGGTDGTATTVVWSPEVVQYDEWLKLSVTAVAEGNAVTAFARGACSWRVKHNEAVWDDATLHVVPPAAPSAGAAPRSTEGSSSPAALTSASATEEAPAGALNVLQNPDFEEAFAERGAGEVTVAVGWHPWWQDGTRQQIAEGYLYRPEYQPERRGEGRGRVHAMNAAQKQFSTYATHRAGVYQRVPVTPGSRVAFSIWVYVWSSAEDDPDVSERPGDYRVAVGIDPTGGTDATAGEVIWSPARQAYDRWVELTVTATAQGSAVTVFTRGEPTWRVKHNDAYWDDATLVVEPASAAPGANAASASAVGALVPGKARVLSPGPPTGQQPGAVTAAVVPSGAAVDFPGAALGGQRVGNVPDVARVPRSLGEEVSLSYAGAHLSLTWQRAADGVRIAVRVPEAIEGELALWHQGRPIARWAIAVIPGDPLALHWPGAGLDTGELGVEVSDADGNVLARCGTVP